MKVYPNALAAKVAGNNIVNNAVNEWLPEAQEAAKNMIGQKVLKVDGSLLEKWRDFIPTPKGVRQFFRDHRDTYALTFILKDSFEFRRTGERDNACLYVERTIRLLYLKERVGNNLVEHVPFKADFTEDFVREKRKERERLSDALHAVEFEISGFGLYDT